jgi:hypothetical protein
MGNNRHLLEEITNLTYRIERDYPELYQFLDENPMTLPTKAHPKVDNKVLKDYLEDLKQILARFKATHNIHEKQT